MTEDALTPLELCAGTHVEVAAVASDGPGKISLFDMWSAPIEIGHCQLPSVQSLAIPLTEHEPLAIEGRPEAIVA